MPVECERTIQSILAARERAVRTRDEAALEDRVDPAWDGTPSCYVMVQDALIERYDAWLVKRGVHPPSSTQAH